MKNDHEMFVRKSLAEIEKLQGIVNMLKEQQDKTQEKLEKKLNDKQEIPEEEDEELKEQEKQRKEIQSEEVVNEDKHYAKIAN